ncbi:MAG TPA: MFS transporter, partial [Burkholderiales bacterium]|nr:MFS transporter [Burkholderiales bacterium]
SQLALWLAALGCLVSAVGTLWALALGALVTGFGYGVTNPAASHLLSRMPPTRHMNLVFSIKQCGVPIGGVLTGLMMPPVTLALGWQAALLVCSGLSLLLSVLLQKPRSSWDGDRVPGAAILASPFESVRLVWSNGILRWLALSSLLYSAVQLSLTSFLVTYLVREIGMELVLAGTILAVANVAGAAGRLGWGWLADRVRSGTLALILNGGFGVAGALATAAIAADWPLWSIAAAVALFGFCAVGWNGVFMAVIVRQSRPEAVALATGGSLTVTYVGITTGPALFAALHDHAGMSYSSGFALLGLVIAAGIGCLLVARRYR